MKLTNTIEELNMKIKYCCEYCNKDFIHQEECEEHINKCFHNPKNYQKIYIVQMDFDLINATYAVKRNGHAKAYLNNDYDYRDCEDMVFCKKEELNTIIMYKSNPLYIRMMYYSLDNLISDNSYHTIIHDMKREAEKYLDNIKEKINSLEDKLKKD